jgi:hypothetical protein
MSNDHTIEFHAKIYVYDLKNCAREFGFKADENWVVSMANSAEKAAIEKQYFPTLSAGVQPEMLAQVFEAVKFKLTQKPARLENALDTAAIRKQHLKYMVAYSPDRIIR